MQKKYLIILLVVVLIIIILILPKPWMSKKQPATNSGNNATTTEAATDIVPFAPITTIPSSQIPKAMPADLPFEKGTQILQNFEVKDPKTGKTQSTRVYVSGKTIEGNYTIYQKYLKDNGWTVQNALSQATVKYFDATKGASRLDIIIAQDDKGQVTVSVSYVN